MKDGKDHIKYFDVCDDLHDSTSDNLALFHLQSIISNPTELIPTFGDDDSEKYIKDNYEIQELDFVDFDYEKLFEQEGPLMAKVWLYHFEIQINWLRQHRHFGHYQSIPFIIEPKWFGYDKKFAEYQKNKMKNKENKYE